MRRALHTLLRRKLAAALLCLGSATVTSAWASPPTKPVSEGQGAPAWAVKPSDTDTGGGMGGTGHTVDNPQGMPLVPLSSTSQVPCPAGQTIGRYTLLALPSAPKAVGSSAAESASSAPTSSPPSAQNPLCLNTIFTLTMGQQVTLFLPNDQRIGVEPQGPKSEARLQTRLVSHRIWGDRLEVDIFAYQGNAVAKVNTADLQIPEGFVGQVSVEGSQSFFSLRKPRRD